MAETNVQVNPSEVLNTVGSIVSLFDRPQKVKEVKTEDSAPTQYNAEPKDSMPAKQESNEDYEQDGDYGDLD